jgi:hypothetical protein
MPPLFNFARRDYSALLEEFFAGLDENLPEYTDRNHSDAGISLARLDASARDKEHHYIDFVAGEGWLAYAQGRQSLIRLGTVVGYLPTLAAAASTRLRLTRAEAGSDVIAIPKYSAFNRADGLQYVTVDAVSIPSGSDSVEVNAVQGTVVEQELTASDFAIVDRTKHPRLKLEAGVAGGFTELTHGDPAQSWTNIDSFWRSWPADLHFLLELNGDTDEVWLVLGDGKKGSLPPSGTMNLRYIRTAGASGNCGHSVIYGVPDGYSGIITCTNIEPATGGAAAEGRESIRSMIPRMVQLQRRAVTTPDYAALLEHQPGVLHCQALDRNTSKYWPHDHMILYVVPDGGGPMSTLLKQQIWAVCGEWGHLGPWKERYILLDAVADPLNVAMRIGVLPNNSPEAVTSAAITSVTNLLAPQNRTIGGRLAFTDLQKTANAVTGLSWVEFDSPKQDVPAENGHIITAGVVTATPQ